LTILAATAPAAELWPGTAYDPAVPTMAKVLGYGPGVRIASHADIMKYMDALAASAPTRMRIVEYARSWERRRLVYAVIGSEANLRRIADLKASIVKLNDPRKTSEAEARRLVATLPAIVGLSYGVHGNEISSPDAALAAAYHLLAAKNDPVVSRIFQNVVVLVDPIQNPDGRDRFVHNFEINEGIVPDPSPVAAERAEPWPGGRTNHYYFDMNRDWFSITQPETAGRIRYLREWLPLVFVDLHEMGLEGNYYFAPAARPHNPHVTKTQMEEWEWFGRNNAKYFDRNGWTYFTRETYDQFYPGYGDAWPWFYGGMGMTYENGSARGLLARRADESLYTFEESVRKHFTTSIATLEAAADHRVQLLENFWSYQKTALEEAQKEPIKEYILPRRGDVSAVDKLGHLLAEHGIEVRRSRAAFRNSGKDYPAGSYTVTLAQPRKRFVRTLLDPSTPLDPEFVKEQERRRKRKLPDEIYDVTAWSLPMLYNVECVAAGEASTGPFDPVTAPYEPRGAAPARADVAYLVPWGTQAAGRFLAAALRADLRIRSVNKGFTQNGRKYSGGTLVLLVRNNPANVHEQVARIATASGAEVVASNTSWIEDGKDFGSYHAPQVRKPVVAIAWDQPANGASAGQTRFLLERQYGFPVTAIRASALGNADLSKFHVLILPDTSGAGYATALSGPAPDRLKAWVRAGGVLIGIGGALNFLSSPPMALLAVQQEGLAREVPAAKPTPQPGAPATPRETPARAPGKILAKPEDYEKAIQADQELPDAVAGAIVRARVDPDLWITAGLPDTLHVLFNGRSIYPPIKQDQGWNAVTFAGPDELVASGLMWEENRKQLAYKPFVVMRNEGQGVVVGFTADPNYRAFMDGLNVLFLNAVFRAAPGRAARGEEE
jgi:hypothetical protein